MVPAFDGDGNLPVGIHLVTWDEFANAFGGTAHRKRLLGGLEAAMDVLRIAGCKRIYIDGSFVTAKRVPNDFDAAWEPAGVDLALLQSMEPVFFDFNNQRVAQKVKFLGEFFPSSAAADLVGRTFLEFFQVDKSTGDPKGIIALDL
ncbi:MAG: hypothetical protein GXX96_26635 [Planctomycetaceae bacterium]|nr:hypothetical protein [Planctomycetaceae bacterium]